MNAEVLAIRARALLAAIGAGGTANTGATVANDNDPEKASAPAKQDFPAGQNRPIRQI